MPLYTYKCRKCGLCNTLFRSIDDRSNVEQCTSCGEPADRVLTTSGFSITGPGVYKEGYSGYKPKKDKNNGANGTDL